MESSDSGVPKKVISASIRCVRREDRVKIKCSIQIPPFDSHFSPRKHNTFFIRWHQVCGMWVYFEIITCQIFCCVLSMIFLPEFTTHRQVEFLPTPNLKFNSIKKMSRRASYLRNYNLVKKKRSTKKVFFYQIGKFPTYLPFLKIRTSLLRNF